MRHKRITVKQLKEKLEKLISEAEDLFLKHRNVCQQIEKELEKISEIEISDVLYQMSDGLVVEVENERYIAPDNIPIKQFLQEYATKR